jgi:hypothetical protein
MGQATNKPIAVDFSDYSGGCNGIENFTRILQNQASDESSGFVFKKSGLAKQPGATGLSASSTFTDFLRGLFSHRLFSGSEYLYGVSGGVLSQISTSDGSLTSKYTMGGALNEAWACDSYGKKFVCNGNTVVKIEDGTAYQVGITAPSGASAAAAAGAGLADGDYSVYVGYARKVDGVNVLYSVGESLGTITLGGGNNRISITLPDSSDPQVNNKVVWIKSPDELIHYFFYETDDNTTTSITISSDSAKETAIIYEYAAADNGLPPATTFIFAFAGRLWGIIDNIFYYSNDGTYSQYNVEKWGAAGRRVTPYKLTGIFSVGLNLYFNTENGILILPFGDVNQKEILIDDRWHFFDMRTVAPWNNGVIGLTNQGVRIFNGERFTDFDLGYPIRNKINKIYASQSNFKPCGFVYRKDFRDEYHLMWQDQSVSSTVNNIHAVLNLSSIIWMDFNNYNLAWEFQPIAGNYAAVYQSGDFLYIGQSHGYASKIYYENPATNQVINVYGSDGILIASATDKQAYMKSRHHIERIDGMMLIDKFYCHSRTEKTFEIRICSGDDRNKKTDWITIPATGGAAVTFPTVFPVVWKSDNAEVSKNKMPPSFWCKSIYVEVRQTDNDINFKLLQLTLFGDVETGNFL